jgi:hypothetical protein
MTILQEKQRTPCFICGHEAKGLTIAYIIQLIRTLAVFWSLAVVT